VEQRGPIEVIEVVSLQPELPPEAVRIGADPLGMPARERVVDVERGDQLQEDLGGLLGGRRLARPAESLLQGLDRPRAEREPETRGRLVREHQRQAE